MTENENFTDISSGASGSSYENSENHWDADCTPQPEQPQPPYEPAPTFYRTPERPQRIRRVGSFTMGVALIACGVLLLSFLLFHNTEMIVAAAKWSPVLLILLGVEILLSNLLFHKDKLKYDFLSGFFCLCLIGGSLFVSMGTVYFDYGIGHRAAEETISQQINDRCYEQLKGTQDIASLNVNVYINGLQQKVPESYDQLRPSDRVHAEIRLLGSDETPLAFAQRCKSLIDRLKNSDLPIQLVNFYAGNTDKDEPEYHLAVGDRFQQDLSAEKLEQLVDVTLPEPPEPETPEEPDTADGDV